MTEIQQNITLAAILSMFSIFSIQIFNKSKNLPSSILIKGSFFSKFGQLKDSYFLIEYHKYLFILKYTKEVLQCFPRVKMYIMNILQQHDSDTYS